MVNQYLYNKLSEITPKVYPDFIPMAVEYPAIMIELIELQNETYKGGSDLTNQTWAVHIVSPTVEARNLLSLEVIDKIEHKSDPAYYIDDCILIDSSTNYDKDVEMYINVMLFEIRVKDYEAYDEDAYDWDFEGTLTIGEYEGEGEVMEYGYRAGWGDDYGSIANFYTYYEYAGIYWTEGVLYVWGVNASVVQIGSVVLNEGTYNSNGYTSFALATNPFTGATIDIKIKGTNMETWDYEGVMTASQSQSNNLHHLFTEEISERKDKRNTSFTGVTIYISPDGSDINTGLSEGLPKKTLMAAYSASANGGIIQCLDGTYDLANESSGYALFNTSGKGVLIKGNENDNTAVKFIQSTGAFGLRFRQCGEFRLENITVETSHNGSTIYIDDYDNRYFVFDNCILTNNNTSASSFILYSAEVRTSGYNKFIQISDCQLNKPTGNLAILVSTQNSPINAEYLIAGNTFNSGGGIPIKIYDGSQGNYYIYDNTFNVDSDNIVFSIGEDTAEPVNNVTGLIDIKSNKIYYGSGYGQHGLLLGRGTRNLIVENNIIYSDKINDTSVIGIIIKSTAVNIGDIYVSGNYIYACRGIIIKGGSKCIITNNSSISTHSTYGYGIEIDNTSNNCRENVITSNKLSGVTAMLRFTEGNTGETSFESSLTSIIDRNEYYNETLKYADDDIQGLITWENKNSFWTSGLNDRNSKLMTNIEYILIGKNFINDKSIVGYYSGSIGNNTILIGNIDPIFISNNYEFSDNNKFIYYQENGNFIAISVNAEFIKINNVLFTDLTSNENKIIIEEPQVIFEDGETCTIKIKL